MPKQSPIPDDLDRPFYDAANQDKLVLQYCTVDDRWQYPPEPVCGGACGSADNLEWRENDGAGTIYSYAVVYDTPIAALQADQPFNCAVIDLDHAPGINFLSHLPGSGAGRCADRRQGQSDLPGDAGHRAEGSRVDGRQVVTRVDELRKGQSS